jgi:predicted metalloprotease with PDZ domain
MKTRMLVLMLAILPLAGRAQEPIVYHLQYSAAGDGHVQIRMLLPEAIKTPATFVFPRTYPGGYEQVPYDSFVQHVEAFSLQGKGLSVRREEYGPRWTIGQTGEGLARIEYQVDVSRMESRILSAVESSKVRKGYVGLLGYSIFGYVEGSENRKIKLEIDAPAGWPALTTLDPHVPAPATSTSADAPDYYALADSEILMGPELQLRLLDGKIPLVLAVYAEGPEDIMLEGAIAGEALDRVQSYFGDTPIRQYTVQLELLRPLPDHEYGFSQEHIDSGTFSLSVDRAFTAESAAANRAGHLFNYAHHMAHSWIPKRAYGVGYRPFTWEMTPVIDTIWFNEGFGRYAAIAAIEAGLPPAEGAAFRAGELSRLRKILNEAPPFIRAMPLAVLSREASFLYALDFRTGMNVFSRGALMAAEMDDRIREKSGGNKSLRDALRALLAWSGENQKPFQLDDMKTIFHSATGVNVEDILNRWLEPAPK